MPALADTLAPPAPPAVAIARATARTTLAKATDLVALTKPRITLMSLVAAAAAFVLAPGPIATSRFVVLLAGVTLIVGCANALNMWFERDVDALMARTKHRPLPAGRLHPNTALGLAATLGALALPILLDAGALPALLAVGALFLYVALYTPLKRVSYHAVWPGAIAGAMPALIGWTAQSGSIDPPGVAIFVLLAIWQIPHTHAIGVYRVREYEHAGLHTLAGDRGFGEARRAIRGFTLLQVAVSLAPVVLGVAGRVYLVTALALGAATLAQALRPQPAARWARGVFLLSLVYVPLVFGALVLA